MNTCIWTIPIINPDILNKRSQKNNEIIECIYVEDIIQYNPANLDALTNINYQYSLTCFMMVLLGLSEQKQESDRIKTKNPDGDREINIQKIIDTLNFLKWISAASGVMAKKIKQEVIPYKKEKTPVIMRSSYNFCTKGHLCVEFYRYPREPTCQMHHFVYNIVKYNIDSMIAFIEHNIPKNKILDEPNMNEIKTSIKTISFVIGHMSGELIRISKKYTNDLDKYHRNNITQNYIDRIKTKKIK